MRTLLDNDNTRANRRTALVAHELGRYNIDIAALSETRFSGEDSLTEVGEGYTFFWKGLPEGLRRLHGVGFAIRTALLRNIPEAPVGLSERLMTWRIPLTNKRYVTIFSVYAPTLIAEEQEKDIFYDTLETALRSVPQSDKIILLGDFNARVGKNHLAWNGTIGKHGIGTTNDNGLRLLTLCSEYNLIITNTLFQQPNKYKTTWQHPRSRHWHLLDYVIVRRSDRDQVHSTRVMRGANCWTDHRLVRSKLSLKIRPQHRRTPPRKKLDIKALSNPELTELLRRNLAENLSNSDTSQDVNNFWSSTQEAVLKAAEDSLGFATRRHEDWFDENAPNIHTLIAAKNKAHNAYLATPHSELLKTQLSTIRAETQRALRLMENNWWTNKARQIQQSADTNDSHGFYEALKTAVRPTKNKFKPCQISRREHPLQKQRSDLSQMG